MHSVVIPSWYPSSETDVDGIFFRLQSQALQREGMKIGMVVPMFRYLRSQPKTIFSRFYGLRRHQQGGLNTYAYDSMYFFPRCPVVDIDRIRWVNAGMKAFEAYIEDYWSSARHYVIDLEHQSNLIQRITDYIDHHYKEDISRTKLAEMVFLSPDHLARKVIPPFTKSPSK